jgi:hypothetical protein
MPAAVRRPLVDVSVGVAVAAIAWWVTGLEPFSLEMTIVVLGAGLAAVALGSRNRRPQATGAPPTHGGVAWVVIAAALAAWQLAAYLQHPRSEHPTLSSLANELLDNHPARAVAFVAWCVVAYQLARR